MKVIDLTHTISEAMPVYPGTGKPKLGSLTPLFTTDLKHSA